MERCRKCPSDRSMYNMQHTLFHKYAASQNYHYTRDINEIMGKYSTRSVVHFIDQQHYDESDEYLKRWYLIDEYDPKIELLTEFYKFHKDLPRWVLDRQILQILNYYYDKKRKIDFYKIQKQIENENKNNPQKPPKGIVGDRPIDSESTPKSESSQPSQTVNVEDILHEISYQKELSHINRYERSRPSSDIQQMVSMLESPATSQNKVTEEQYMVKKTQMAKKALKLDDLALSLSSRVRQNPQEAAKMPLSARYQGQTYKLLEQKQKHSQTTSREKDKCSKDNFIQAASQYLQKNNQAKQLKKPTPQLQNKKSIPEIKQLELKILKSLSELEKQRTAKMVSLDSKALQNILQRFTNHTPRGVTSNHLARQPTPKQNIITHKSTDNIQSILKKQQPRAGSHTSSQIKALDLKKLMMAKQEECSKLKPESHRGIQLILSDIEKYIIQSEQQSLRITDDTETVNNEIQAEQPDALAGQSDLSSLKGIQSQFNKMINSILITGGLGYIGSITAVQVKQAFNLNVVIVDNLSNSDKSVIDRITKSIDANATEPQFQFHEIDLKNYEQLRDLFSSYSKTQPIRYVIHFAALKAVGESVKNPIKYYENNVIGSINLLKCMDEFQCPNFLFSSSATVYAPGNFVDESAPFSPSNPYGETKVVIEYLLKSYAAQHQGRYLSLRYFNPVGATKDGLLGEMPLVPLNLFPYIEQVAIGKKEKLFVYGNDYPTEDGTGVRDYIHVLDLVKGHIAALQKIIEREQQGQDWYDYFNLGTGKGHSVLDAVKEYQKLTNIPYEIVGRRPGDVSVLVADPRKAKEVLQFEATLTLKEMCEDSFRFISKNS